MIRKGDYIGVPNRPYISKLEISELSRKLYGRATLPGTRDIGAACNCNCNPCDCSCDCSSGVD